MLNDRATVGLADADVDVRAARWRCGIDGGLAGFLIAFAGFFAMVLIRSGR